jgi:hypothetical protein
MARVHSGVHECVGKEVLWANCVFIDDVRWHIGSPFSETSCHFQLLAHILRIIILNGSLSFAGCACARLSIRTRMCMRVSVCVRARAYVSVHGCGVGVPVPVSACMHVSECEYVDR